jgi:hypothetical protein
VNGLSVRAWVRDVMKDCILDRLRILEMDT